jgi:hypothetical protein
MGLGQVDVLVGLELSVWKKSIHRVVPNRVYCLLCRLLVVR